MREMVASVEPFHVENAAENNNDADDDGQDEND